MYHHIYLAIRRLLRVWRVHHSTLNFWTCLSARTLHCIFAYFCRVNFMHLCTQKLWYCHLILHIVFLAGRTVGSSQRRAGLCLHHRWHHVRRATGRGRDSHEASRRCSYGHRDRKRHRRRGAAESVARGLVGHLQSGRLHHAKQTLILWALYPLDMLVRSSLHTTELETHRIKEDAAPLVYT